MTDCAIIGKFGTDNLALAVESHNILIYTCSIHDNICKTSHLKDWIGTVG